MSRLAKVLFAGPLLTAAAVGFTFDRMVTHYTGLVLDGLDIDGEIARAEAEWARV
jgi:hypothetical protein